MKLRFQDILLNILLFVFVAAFPVDLFQIPETYKLLILIALRILLLVYYVYIIVWNRIKIFGNCNYRNLLLCVPFLLACFSNIIASRINGSIGPITMSPLDLSLNIILCILTAIIEEIIFRLFIHNSLTNVGSFKRILGSAGIFAAMHLINLANVRNVDALVTVLVQVIYDFGLGLLLGFMYEYSYSLPACIIFHFAFNLFNQVLVKYFMIASTVPCFYLTAIVIGAVLVIYVVCLYFFHFKKLDRYFRS